MSDKYKSNTVRLFPAVVRVCTEDIHHTYRKTLTVVKDPVSRFPKNGLFLNVNQILTNGKPCTTFDIALLGSTYSQHKVGFIFGMPQWTYAGLHFVFAVARSLQSLVAILAFASIQRQTRKP
ncbi:MAG: hypothetical protein MUE81_17420 [Thermoflexibacter sp.]|nr:hypothetical protein [Thermoflexibacter sp.]